ncbi:glycoside hydrolase family 43 protein [Paenibacillus sp. GCM10027626]|uniref:glycoside hydrolase family 43 protein n=1 Tax=Paenibacillus sp. GCM10027626 TaxID=3273411 RepID=UPI0036442971
MRLADIHIRDPFVLVEEKCKTYYMYGTIGKTAWEGRPEGFHAFVSHDLEQWDGPFNVFQPAPDFWSDHHYWAPEVHEYKGRYYMFASFKADGVARATQILAADHPLGPFEPHGEEPITPTGWECLDGTLYVESNEQGDRPWIVFCREWLEVKDGQIWAMPLSADLREAAGDPLLLFSASEAAWVRPAREKDEFVTDGPFLYRDEAGRLLMLWSSAGAQGYAMGRACSASGTIEGPWVQEEQPMFASDGGHGMIFRSLTGMNYVSLHAPNVHPNERPIFIAI